MCISVLAGHWQWLLGWLALGDRPQVSVNYRSHGSGMKEELFSWGMRGQAVSTASDLLKVASHLQHNGMENFLDQSARKGVHLGVWCL